ncbi:unnamed protein product [Candidula unifasciata]|uniref:Alpha-type protein kinase domain-containing protein n=1 Tax=Candidula unifasciata TaxID=100452 RepID=A0A8S3Z5L4_9EUPU|nr:unnamed protein product [Candidula unifasciata]
MDRVSNLTKWLADKDDGRGLTQDEWISVEEFIPGKMGRFCPWSTKHTKDNVDSKHMQAFSHFTYKYTGGDMVACDFQGVFDPVSSRYSFTDSTIHSAYKLYGLFDQGEHGISEFFKLHKCNEICSDWPRPTPLTPPPSFEAACSLQRNLTPAREFENIIFPSHGRETVEPGITYSNQENTRHRITDERRRHRSEHHQRQMPTGASWFGNSVDLYHSERRFNRNKDPVFGSNSAIGEDVHELPTYENTAVLRGVAGEPPPYESLVTPGDKRKQLKSGSLSPSEAVNRSLNPVSNFSGDSSRENNLFRFRKRSATCPLLHEECHCSCVGETPWISNTQLASQSYLTQSAVHNYEEASPVVPSAPSEEVSLILPSAPPQEFSDIR